jgi:hypothetical protein
MELLCKLLDLPALLDAVVLGVVHRAPWPALIAVGGLVQSLVTAWALAPTSRCSDSGGRGSACKQLVVVGLLLLLPILVLVLATALSNDICYWLASLPCCRSRLGVPSTPFCSPGAFIRHVEELRDVFHLVGGQLLEHLLISHALSKSDNNKNIGDAGMVFQTWENHWMKDRSDSSGAIARRGG